MQDTVQTVQALKAASSQMKTAMRSNKELDLNFIDNLQVCAAGRQAGGMRKAWLREDLLYTFAASPEARWPAAG